METAIGFIVGFLLFAGFVAWMVHLERSYPLTQRPKVIEALEEAEHLGDTDITTDLKKVAHRWTLLRQAGKEPKKYGVLEYKERIDAQLKVLEPHNKTLWGYMGRGAGPDLGGLANL